MIFNNLENIVVLINEWISFNINFYMIVTVLLQ